MKEEPGFTPNSPFRPRPRKPSFLMAWVFLGLIVTTVAFLVADHIFGDRGGSYAVAASIVFNGAWFALDWWAGTFDKRRAASRRNQIWR